MMKKLLLLSTFLFPAFLFAQSEFSDCDHVFTSVQHLPSLKISNEAFEDTLASLLRSRKFSLKDDEITYNFLVTKASQIDVLTIKSGNVRKEKVLEETILALADLWKPAVQNGYDVCCYVSLKLKFVDNKINIEIMP